MPSRGNFRNYSYCTACQSTKSVVCSVLMPSKLGCWSNRITFLLIVLSFFPLGKMGEGLFRALVQLGGQDCQSSECASQLTLLPHVDPALKALQLTEGLRVVLEGQGGEEEQDSLRKQVSTDTARVILKWLERDEVSSPISISISILILILFI